MPKINNVEFLTLPQQVNKNKKDIQANTSGIDSLNQAVQNITVGIANIPMLSGIIIAALGVPQALSGSNKAILLDNLKNQAAIKDDNKTISWALHLQVMGSLVGDSAFPTSLVDYDINLSNITFAGADNNRFYRVRGFSRDFTFVIECNVDTTQDVWSYTLDPTITMSTIVQPSVYYALASYIVGGVVHIGNLSPSGQWVKVGDMVIAGSGLYKVDSVVGSNVNVTTLNTYVAPSGTFSTERVKFDGNNMSLLTNEQRLSINKLLGCDIVSSSITNDKCLQAQIESKGLEFLANAYLSIDKVVLAGVETLGSTSGVLAIRVRNTTENTITPTGNTAVPFTDVQRSMGYIELHSVAVSSLANPIYYDPAVFNWRQKTVLYYFVNENINDTVIPSGYSVYIIMKF